MVLFLRSIKSFHYIPENESEQDVLGWNKSSSRDLRSLEIKARLQYKKNYSSFMITGLSNLRNPKTSVMKSGEGVWHI